VSQVPLRIYWFFYFFFFFHLQANEWSVTVHSEHSSQEIDEQIQKLPDLIIIDSVQCNAEDLRDMIPFVVNDSVSHDQLKAVISELKKSNRFQLITVSVTQHADKYQLSFDIERCWIFAKLKLSGFQKREQFRHYYKIEPGEPFDYITHNVSIAQIKEALRQNGYFDAQVIDSFVYDYKSKQLTVHITINENARYRVHTSGPLIITQQLSVSEQEQLGKKIKKRVLHSINGSFYESARICAVTNAIKEYLYQKGFCDAVIELNEIIDQIDLSVHVNVLLHLAKQRNIIVTGNKYFKKKEIFQAINDLQHTLDYVPERFIKENLEQKYGAAGFLNAQIAVTREDANIRISVQEGPRATIKKIIIEGSVHISPERLLKQFFHSVIKNRYYDETILKDVIRRLTDYYARQGFWNASVLKHSLQPLDDHHKEYALKIQIEEDTQMLVSKVSVAQFPELIKSMPFKHCANKKTVPLNPVFIQEQKQWLFQHFNKIGYWNVRVWHELYKNADQSYEIIWHIDPGSQIVFGKTIFMGTTQLPARKLVKLLEYNEGEPWDKDKFSRSFDRFSRMGIFQSIHMQAEKSTDVKRNVLIKLIEDDPYEIRARFGFQQVSRNFTFRAGTTYKVGGAVLIKNPTNTGDVLRFDADVTRFYRNLCLNYARPIYFRPPFWITGKVYSNTYDQPVVQGTARTLYKAFQQGFLIGFANYTRHVDAGLNIGIETMETSHLSKELAAVINFKPALVDKKALQVFFEPNFLIDFLDNKINPTKGSLSMVSGKINIPCDRAAVRFFKILAEQSIFASIRTVIFGLHIRLGHVFGQQFMKIMPPDRFYLGGENSLRGYGPDQAPPFGIYVDDKGDKTLVPQGGKTLFNVIFEVRFPIYWQFLQGAIFQDFGTLIGDSFSKRHQEFGLASTGFGLRYLAPIGPIRFDIGFKWKKRNKEERRFAWFLTMGQAF
jgi:outer membrane protein insertion porin family